MYRLVMDCRDGPDRMLPPELMAKLAGLCGKLGASVLGEDFAEVNRRFPSGEAETSNRLAVPAVNSGNCTNNVSPWWQNTLAVMLSNMINIVKYLIKYIILKRNNSNCKINISFADLAQDLQPTDVWPFDRFNLLATDVEKFWKGVLFWQENTQPVPSKRVAAGLSALVLLTGGDKEYSSEVSTLVSEIEQILRQ